MKCPECGNIRTDVKKSSRTYKGSTVTRRRVCPNCSHTFTTWETMYDLNRNQFEANRRLANVKRELTALLDYIHHRIIPPDRTEEPTDG